jgi:superfamily I DNA/RNA helicase
VEELEPEALEAIKARDVSVLVTAGPGAGKTEFLAQKALYLLQTGICPPPRRILAISFKRDAAHNLAERVERRGGPILAQRFDSFTFDAFAKGLFDRFRAGLPRCFAVGRNYDIVFPRRCDYEVFLEQRGFRSIAPDRFENAVAERALPVVGHDDLTRAIHAWWAHQLGSFDRPKISFSMINRLVVLLLTNNPMILRAVRLTYPFALLDEFQDTTRPQFELIHTLFEGTSTRLTAVGDDLQRIMGWAGAMENAFEGFEERFRARRFTMSWNWRAHPKLAEVQSAVAEKVLRKHRAARGRASCHVENDAVEIWGFETEEQERTTLAAWLARQIQAQTLRPHDCAIIVRQRTDNAVRRLTPYFCGRGLALRDVGRNVKDISIQDLLAEPLTKLLLSALRLVTFDHQAEARSVTVSRLLAFEGLDRDDEAGSRRRIDRFDRELENIRREVRSQPVLPADNSSSAALAKKLLALFGEAKVRAALPAYARDVDFVRVRDGFVALLDECRGFSGSWEEAIDRFEGVGQIPVMTIHKSKGLEYHTVVFFGLDRHEWAGLAENKSEELRAFYVALTRAKQRAIFTRRRGAEISWLEAILSQCGVEVRPAPREEG